MASSRSIVLLAVPFAALALAAGCATGTSGFGGEGGSGAAPLTSTSSSSTSGASASSSTGASSSGMGGASTSSSSSSTSASSSSTSASSTTSASSSSTTSASSSTSASSASSTSGATCAIGHLVISEIRSRGIAGGSDEFVELYNPTGSPVTLDDTWTLEARSNSAMTYGPRWTGTGMIIPAHGHYLIATITGMGAYAQAPAADAGLTSGITDATSLRLSHSGTVIDAVCYAFDDASAMPFATSATYTCEGAPVTINPHDNGTGTNVDASIERKPGGAAGNCTDSDDNASDFAVQMPSTPRNAASAPTP